MAQIFGTAPNQVPTNADLGTMAYQDSNNYYNVGQTVGFRNRIINGDMRIDQRNAGASYTVVDDAYTLDRWKAYRTNSSVNSKFSIQQNAGSVTPPVGFTHYLGVTSLSAYSVGSGDYFLINQWIEGYNTADFGWGTTNAVPVTLSFWVRSSLTGIFGGSLLNGNFNRTYPFTYTINSANTWTPISITIPGETTGTWGSNNSGSIQVRFVMGCGSSRLASIPNAWVSSGYDGPTGSTSVVGTNGATWYITGVQLEKGTAATNFEHREFGEELRRCQRYYETSFNYGTAPFQGGIPGTDIFAGFVAACYASTALRLNPIYYKVIKRTSPTITIYRPGSTWGGTTDGRWSAYNTSNWVGASATGVTDGYSGTSGFGVDMSVSGTSAASAYICMGGWSSSAEL